MATMDELFNSSNGGTGRRFMKFESDGEAFLLVQTAEPKLVPQRNDKDQIVYLVQVDEGGKWQPMGEGTFSEGEVHASFMPDKEIVIPAKVVGKKLKDGSKDENFQPFDTEWTLTKDQRGKFKDAMMDAGVPAETGTRYVLKRLNSAKKPYTYSVKILTD